MREMGFGELLCLVDRSLLKNLCYWLTTRIVPIDELFRDSDGRVYKLSKNQVWWVLGIPKGNKVVPRRVMDEEMRSKVEDIERNYGAKWEFARTRRNCVEKYKGILANNTLVNKGKGNWEEEQEAEFKTVFLILVLQMVLCPSQSKSHILESDLVPALTCAMQAKDYDWCGLVLEKLFDNGCRFANKFNANGYARGCGGCSIFLAVSYFIGPVE